MYTNTAINSIDKIPTKIHTLLSDGINMVQFKLYRPQYKLVLLVRIIVRNAVK